MTVNFLNQNTFRHSLLLLALVLFIASLMRLYTSMTMPIETGTDWSGEIAASEPVNIAEKINYAELGEWHLFGIASAQPEQAAPVEADLMEAPETGLSLQLLGTFYSADTQQSLAIIDADKGEQKYYRVGDKLPGNAELSQIGRDRVVIQRAGKYESLKMRFVEGAADFMPLELSQMVDD
ncbi:MAG: type II secretion system protein N [Chromatiales bacterium]|jgi:general secretion pathway protein C